VVWIKPKLFSNEEKSEERGYVKTTEPSLNANVYVVPVALDADRAEWAATYRSVASLEPGLVYTTPSSFLASVFALQSWLPKMSCPVMFTGETLFEDVRAKAIGVYSRVIDKMRCWDTGLSFVECRFGTKHIDDELCLVEESAGRITSTDFFNFAAKLHTNITDDLGTIEMAHCRCGVYGRVFVDFIGKSMQCLWTKEGTVCDPHLVLAYITSFLKAKGEPYVRYLIRQKQDGAVLLFIDQDNDRSALTVKNVLQGMLHQSVQIKPYDQAPNHGRKLLLVASEFSPVF